MKVIASCTSDKPGSRPTYGELVGSVISDLTQGSKSAYLITLHPTYSTSVLLVSLESTVGSVTPVLKTTELGNGYVVRPNATVVLQPNRLVNRPRIYGSY